MDRVQLRFSALVILSCRRQKCLKIEFCVPTKLLLTRRTRLLLFPMTLLTLRDAISSIQRNSDTYIRSISLQ